MTDKMTRERVVEMVADARDKGQLPNLSDLDLSGLDLRGLDLRGANLSGADLTHAKLIHTDLRRANLRRANLRRADLCYADLCYADLAYADLPGAILRRTILTNADLYRADLAGAKLCGLIVDGLPSGGLVFIPTTEGWHLAIGCWKGTTDELRAMIAKDEGWPEAEGEEVTVRRPLLAAMADACDAYVAANPHAVADVKSTAARWKENR